jgi:hypothetical protein
MATFKSKSVQIEALNHAAELMVNKLYNLRKKFQATYSGKLRCGKYEETREFTISLNYAIFTANQLLTMQFVSEKNIQELEGKFNSLDKKYSYLIQ